MAGADAKAEADAQAEADARAEPAFMEVIAAHGKEPPRFLSTVERP